VFTLSLFSFMYVLLPVLLTMCLISPTFIYLPSSFLKLSKQLYCFPCIMYVHRNISLSWPTFLPVNSSILCTVDILKDNCVLIDHSFIQTHKQAVYFPLWPCSDSCYKVAERKLFPTTYIQSWELVSSELQQWR
jgi:hypothetical protein